MYTTRKRKLDDLSTAEGDAPSSTSCSPAASPRDPLVQKPVPGLSSIPSSIVDDGKNPGGTSQITTASHPKSRSTTPRKREREVEPGKNRGDDNEEESEEEEALGESAHKYAIDLRKLAKEVEKEKEKEREEPPLLSPSQRDFGKQLSDKMHIIDSQLSGLQNLADGHNISQYLADIFTQFDTLSVDLKHRLSQLSQLDGFLKRHCGATCAGVQCSYFSVLPGELNVHILSFLTAKDLRIVSQVNREWHRYALDESLWKRLCDNRWQGSRRYINRFEPEMRYKHSRKSWKDVYAYRVHVDDNWNRGRCSRVLTLSGHDSQVCCSQYDEDKIVSGSFDATIRMWDIRNLDESDDVKCIMTLKKTESNNAHTDRVLCLMFQNERLVTGGRDESVKIWDLPTGTCLSTLVGHTDNVWYLQFDENRIISGSADKTMRFWDIRTGQCQSTLVGHDRGLSCLHFEDDVLMSGSADKTIKLWDMRTGECRLTLEGHTEAVYCLYYYNHKLITGGEDTTAKVWDIDTGRCTNTFSDELCKDRHKGAIYCMQFDSQRLITGSYDHTIKVWDINTEECLHTFGKGNTTSASANASPTNSLHTTASPSNNQFLDYHDSTVRRIQFDDQKMVSASADKTIKIWDLSG